MPDASEIANRPEPDPEPRLELTLGQGRPLSSRPPSPPRADHAPDDLLEDLERRCRAKSNAVGWVAERERGVAEGLTEAPERPRVLPILIDWAEGLADAYHWASADDRSPDLDPSCLDRVSGCFLAMAEAAALARQAAGKSTRFERALRLATEAQSACRVALARLGVPDDPDQLDAFEWVRTTTARHRIYIDRFMRANDPADPDAWGDLLDRIDAAAAEHALPKPQALALSRLRDLVVGPEGSTQDVDPGDWGPLVEAVIEAGVAPSNRELRELVLPLLDASPPDEPVPHGLQLVLREIDRFLSQRPAPRDPGARPVATAEVRDAAELLSGRSVVLIGGLRRPEAQDALRRAFRLRELVWISTREHQSIRGFEPAIARPEVAVVLLAIRWSSHSFGDVKVFCDRHERPLVRLPGGYAPNQVAAQILSQCGQTLRADDAE